MRLWLGFAFVLLVLLPGAPPPTDRRFLESRATQGDAEAQFLIGMQYLDGYGVRRDEAKAEAWLLKAAESGHVEAACALGELYAEGETPKDPAQAEKWLGVAAARGNRTAIESLRALQARSEHRETASGTTSTPEEDPAETVRWSLILSALRGPDAFVVRGYLLENGIAMNRDLEAAAASYRKAAEAGNALGQCQLGQLYVQGRGVRRDLVEGCVWLRRAQAAGVAAAAAALAEVEPDLTPRQKAAVESRVKKPGGRTPAAK